MSLLCAPAAVIMSVWLFVGGQMPAPPVVCDSTALMTAAHGRPNALAAYWNETVYLPTHGYSDATLAPILAHEFCHALGCDEKRAYAMQAFYIKRRGDEK